jgi:hypothetical protein
MGRGRYGAPKCFGAGTEHRTQSIRNPAGQAQEAQGFGCFTEVWGGIPRQ